jgi:hypothetical protein
MRRALVSLEAIDQAVPNADPEGEAKLLAADPEKGEAGRCPGSRQPVRSAVAAQI